MAILDYKITAQDLDGKGNVGMPDTPNLTTQEMQEKLDELAREVIIPRYNDLIDEMSDELMLDKAITSTDITNMRLNSDGKILVSTDHGGTWQTGGASGHLIMNGNGETFPSRSRLQFSSNATITDYDEEHGDKTLISVRGEKGDKGDGATIRVGTVTEGENAEVENVGSYTDAIFNFSLPKGDTGEAATIQIGTVTSGENASVNNRGTSSEAIFDFTLPKGDKGDPGTGLAILDTYATLTELQTAHPTGRIGDAYFVGDDTNGVIYVWSTSNNAWFNTGSIKGAQGERGRTATVSIGSVTSGSTPAVENVGTSEDAIFNFTLQPGVQGVKGDAATISVGTVTSGDEVAVTNVGTSSNAILNFTLQRGEKGDKGDKGDKGEADVYIMTGTLAQGSTQLVINNNRIMSNALYDFYTDVFGVIPTDVTVITGRITLTFDPQETNVSVKVLMREE